MDIKVYARKSANVRPNMPVVVIPDSDQSPRQVGMTWHYINASGNVLWSRYRGYHFKPGWMRGVSYCASTLRVEVGQNWNPYNQDDCDLTA